MNESLFQIKTGLDGDWAVTNRAVPCATYFNLPCVGEIIECIQLTISNERGTLAAKLETGASGLTIFSRYAMIQQTVVLIPLCFASLGANGTNATISGSQNTNSRRAISSTAANGTTWNSTNESTKGTNSSPIMKLNEPCMGLMPPCKTTKLWLRGSLEVPVPHGVLSSLTLSMAGEGCAGREVCSVHRWFHGGLDQGESSLLST